MYRHCRTALSGPVRAFFYAGAWAMLVAHWEVDSDAGVHAVSQDRLQRPA